MNHDDARRTVLEVLRTVAPEVTSMPIADDRSLRSQLDLDSLDFLAYVERLVERTGKQVAESDYPQVDTIDGCAQFLADVTPASR
jgi:acyl carrier protein